MKWPILIYTIVLLLLVFSNFTVFAETAQPYKLNLEDSIAIRTDKIKDTMSDTILKIATLHQLIDANPSAFLVPTHVNKDAGPLLNPRLDWLNTENNNNNNNNNIALKMYLATQGTARLPSLNLPTEITTKLDQLIFDKSFKATDYNIKNLDFNWLVELQNYDYWNLEDRSPLAHITKLDFTAYPTPNFTPMIAWAKLRLIKGVQENNVTAAIDEALHLGRILHSTETLEGALTGIIVQEQVLKFAEMQHKLIRFDAKILNKAKIYFSSLGKALSIPFTNATAYLKLLQITSGPGACAAANTAAPILLKYKSLLENDLKPVYVGFTNLLKSSARCRWKIIRKAWAGDSIYPQQFTGLLNLSLKARRNETDSFKKNISAEEYQQLSREISNPRWPQLYVFLLALKINIDQIFSELSN